jgi:rubredoxin-NAD+ reductase
MGGDRTPEYDIIIIGSGLAGYTLVKELRKQDKEQGVLIVTKDDGHYYSKPLLSTGLSKNKTPEQLSVANNKTMASQLNATVLTFSEVEKVDSQSQSIYLSGEQFFYQKLVFATGASCNRLNIPGFNAKGVMSINDLMDYRNFREQLRGKQNIVIMGAGLIGCEYANDLLATDCQVTLVEPASTSLHGLVSEIAGNALVAGLSQSGVSFKFNDYVTKIEQTENGLLLTLNSGNTLEAELVISAVGLRPNIALATEAGIKSDKGILVDRTLASSVKNVFALGDCAQVEGKVLTYVLPLMACARALAKTLCGETTQVSYGVMPIATKTPACPVVVYPPLSNQGHWEFEGEGANIKGLFKDNNHLLGFVLTGEFVNQKQALSKLAQPIHA